MNVENVFLLFICWGLVGEKCDVICNGGILVNIVYVVCFLLGVWDRDIVVMCSLEDKFGNFFLVIILFL